MCSVDRLARYDEPPKFESIIHSWDIGATLEGNPSVCTKWAVARDSAGRDNIYLTDVVRLKVEIPDVRAAIKAHDRIDKPDLIILDHRVPASVCNRTSVKPAIAICILRAKTGPRTTARSIVSEKRFSTCTMAS